MGGLNAGSRAPRVTAPKKRGTPNHRAKRPVVDETALAAMKAERARQEYVQKMARPEMVRIIKAIDGARPQFARAIERVTARRAAMIAVPQHKTDCEDCCHYGHPTVRHLN